jgi:hypothetical protein
MREVGVKCDHLPRDVGCGVSPVPLSPMAANFRDPGLFGRASLSGDDSDRDRREESDQRRGLASKRRHESMGGEDSPWHASPGDDIRSARQSDSP